MALDAFEAHLHQQADRMADGRYAEISAFAPPSDLPPLPETLAPRAAELLARAVGLVERGDRLREETARRLAPRRRRGSFRAPSAAYVDRLA